MNITDTVAGRDLEALRAAIAGQVLVPRQAGYDQARQAWNLAVDQRPAVVVEAGSAADVARAVRYARAHGIRIAPQGTGHGAGPLEPLDGAMLLRTTRMRNVSIDPAARTARAKAGAVWQDVTVPAAQHGLAALAGNAATVGVTGYTLGGGLGWLARRYGLAANSVTAAELVTPDGNLVRADAGRESDLFWAVRGGGGIGVVTALEMRLYPVGDLYAGSLFFPIARAAEVLHAWREWTDTVPERGLLPGPPGAAAAGAAAPRTAARPGLRQGRGRLPRRREHRRRADPAAAPARPGTRHLRDHPTLRARPAPHGPRPAGALSGAGAFLSDVPTAAIDALVGLAGPDADTLLASVEVGHLGGALARPAPGGGAQPSIDANYLLTAVGAMPAPDLAAAVHAQTGAVKDALGPWHAGYNYYNFEETPAPASAVLPPASYRRLQQIKTAYDPDQAIVSAHPVRPARP